MFPIARRSVALARFRRHPSSRMCHECCDHLRLSVPGLWCAVERRDFPVGDKPTRQLSLRPVAIGAVVEVTKRLKPSV